MSITNTSYPINETYFRTYLVMSTAHNFILNIMMIYIIVKLHHMDNKLPHNACLHKANTFQKELLQIKSKSFDMVDSNIVINKSVKQMQTEIDILRYKQYCYQKDIQKYQTICDEIRHLKENYSKLHDLYSSEMFWKTCK